MMSGAFHSGDIGSQDQDQDQFGEEPKISLSHSDNHVESNTGSDEEKLGLNDVRPMIWDGPNDPVRLYTSRATSAC